MSLERQTAGQWSLFWHEGKQEYSLLLNGDAVGSLNNGPEAHRVLAILGMHSRVDYADNARAVLRYAEGIKQLAEEMVWEQPTR